MPGCPWTARLAGSALSAAAVPLCPLDEDPCPACSADAAAGTAAASPAAAGAAGAAAGAAAGTDPVDASIRMEEIALATFAVAGSATTARPWAVGSLLALRDAEADCRMLLLMRMQAVAAAAPSQSDCGCSRHCCALRRLSWDCCFRYCRAGRLARREARDGGRDVSASAGMGEWYGSTPEARFAQLQADR
jgi:hypothetical protein